VKASARIRVERRNERDEVVERASEAPLSVRRCGDRVLVASSAATPVGGDRLDLCVVVGPGASADVGSVAATMVWPGADGASSMLSTTCDVAAGGSLRWRSEPTVSVIGSVHRSATLVRLVGDARCVLVEEIVLGRTGEPSGRLDTEIRVERDGRALVHHHERYGPDVPGALSSVSVGSARHVLTAVLVGTLPDVARVVVEATRAAAWMPMESGAVSVLAVGPDRPSVLDLVGEVAPELGLHHNGKTIRP
jgi:urease accessory protein